MNDFFCYTKSCTHTRTQHPMGLAAVFSLPAVRHCCHYKSIDETSWICALSLVFNQFFFFRFVLCRAVADEEFENGFYYHTYSILNVIMSDTTDKTGKKEAPTSDNADWSNFCGFFFIIIFHLRFDKRLNRLKEVGNEATLCEHWKKRMTLTS